MSPRNRSLVRLCFNFLLSPMSLLATSLAITSTTLLCSAVETKITFEGRYEYRTDTESLEIIGRRVCFFPSKPSSENVPRPIGDRRTPWFCFTNSKHAADSFGLNLNVGARECGVRGDAKIVVSGYTRHTGEGDGNDVARLDTVLETSKPESLPCSK